MRGDALFRFLEDPDAYLPGLWDLSRDRAAARHWLEVLRASMAGILRRVHAETPSKGRPVEEAAAWFAKRLDEWEADPALRSQRNTVHALVAWREQALHAFGVGDPFARIKAAENARCEPAYRAVVDRLDAEANFEAAVDAAVWGALAGNVFDVASPDVSRALDEGRGLDGLVGEVRRRALLVDDRPAAAARLEALCREGNAQIGMFLDNAGMDLILGAVPFARLLACRGATVLLVANEAPALNDTTAAETAAVLQRLAGADPVTASSSRTAGSCSVRAVSAPRGWISGTYPGV